MASKDESLNNITLKGTLVSELKVTDIKRELEKRGLSKSGSKQQLSERLQAQLLLEKLQQDAAQSSGDELEGKAPNIGLQQDNKAGQSEFVRQYLEQQQRNLEIQMEVKKQVEEERKRKSADESSADESNPAVKKVSNDPDVTSPKKFKDDSSNAPAKSKEKMPKPARKSSRNTSKDENGQESEKRKEHSRSPTPENERLRERTRSGSSSSSRSPTPEKPTRSRRGRQARGRASKRGGGRRKGNYAAKSRSSSSSSEEMAPKRKQRRTNSRSSRSRSRSPQMVSPEVTRRSSRRIVANRATPEHPADEEMEDKLASKGKKSEAEEISEQQTSPSIKRQKVSAAEIPTDAPLEKSAEETAAPVPDSLHPTETDEPMSEESNKPVAPVASSFDDIVKESSVDIVKDTSVEIVKEISVENVKETSVDKIQENPTNLVKKSSAEISAFEPVSSKEDSGENQLEEKLSIVDPLPILNYEPSLNEAEIESVHPVDSLPDLVKSPVKETETQAEKCPSSSGDKVKQTESAVESSNLESQSYKSKISVEPTNLDKDITDKNTRKSPSKSPPSRSRRKSSSSSSSSSGSRTRSKSPVSKPTRSRSSSSSQSRSRSRSSSSSSSSDSSGTKPSRIFPEKKILETLASPPAQENVASTELQDKSRISSQSVDTQAVKHDDESKPSEDTMPSAEAPAKQQTEPDKASDHHDEAQKNTVVPIAMVDKADGAEGKDKDTKIEDATQKKEKVAKKRKWNSKTSKAARPVKRTTSLEISSDSLKNLIGDVKLTETVFDMDTEVVNTLDYDDHEEDKRDVKMKRTIVQSPKSDDMNEEVSQGLIPAEDIRIMELQEDEPKEELKALPEKEKKIVKLAPHKEKEAKKVKEVKKLKKKKDDGKESAVKEAKEAEKENKEQVIVSTRPIRSILPAVDEPEPVSGHLEPARNPPDRVIRISGLVRPFTVGQLKELLKRSGELDEEYFWINDIKSHCLAAYKSQEDAVKARAALHKTKWPQSNPKILQVEFATIEDVVHRKAEGLNPLPAPAKKPVDAKRIQEQKEEEEQRERRQKARDLREKEREEREKEKHDEKERVRKREAERKNPVREWDRDKVQQLSKSRSRSKEKERQRRSRSRSNEKGQQRKRRDPSRDKKEDEKKKDKKQKENKTEEEPPAKLLDDLFRKTKAVPCIYWLPLTEEQAAQRVIRKQELEKERQKRIAAAEEREKEEMKRREALRLERQRERERERSRERESRRQERSRSSRSDSRSRSRRRR